MKTSKEEIVQAATKLFIRKGFHGVNLTDIEGAVGITRGGLFYHIDGKDDIYRESQTRFFLLLQENEEKFLSLKTETFASFIEEYANLVDKMASDLKKLLDPHPYGGYFTFFHLVCTDQPEFLKKFDKMHADQIALWKGALQNGIINKEVNKDIDVDTIAHLFRESYLGLAYTQSANKGIQAKQLKKQFTVLYDLIKA